LPFIQIDDEFFSCSHSLGESSVEKFFYRKMREKGATKAADWGKSNFIQFLKAIWEVEIGLSSVISDNLEMIIDLGN
jgi:hypothetical protein